MATSFWPRHEADEVDALARVLQSGRTNYWTGEEGVSFEREFAAYTGARHALTVSNGTTALEVALYALRLPKGSGVLVPARTFIACASVVANAGFVPVVADIDVHTLNVTVATLEGARQAHDEPKIIPAPAVYCAGGGDGGSTYGDVKYEKSFGNLFIAPRIPVSAAIIVHFAGLPANMHGICRWAADHDIKIVEDCAHAHGARINGRHVGTFGDIGCFSMCVGKNMSTGGEGGMIITDSTVLADRMMARRDHGRWQMVGNRDERDLSTFKYTVENWGVNARLTEMQSAIGRVQLKKLDGWLARRREIAARYDSELEQVVLRQPNADGHALYLYMARVNDFKREHVLKECHAAGVRWGGCGNITQEPVFGGAQAMPNADSITKRVVSLPIYPTMTDDDVGAVILSVKHALGWAA